MPPRLHYVISIPAFTSFKLVLRMEDSRRTHSLAGAVSRSRCSMPLRLQCDGLQWSLSPKTDESEPCRTESRHFLLDRRVMSTPDKAERRHL